MAINHTFFQSLFITMAEAEGKHQKTPASTGPEEVAHFMAGAVRLELTTYGFGDRCSTS